MKGFLKRLSKAITRDELDDLKKEIENEKEEFLLSIKENLIYVSPSKKREYIDNVTAYINLKKEPGIEIFAKDENLLPFGSKKYPLAEEFELYNGYRNVLDEPTLTAFVQQITLGLATDFRDTVVKLRNNDYEVEKAEEEIEK